MEELPDDILGCLLDTILDIRAFASTCWRVYYIASGHPDMKFWRSRNKVEISHLSTPKLHTAATLRTSHDLLRFGNRALLLALGRQVQPNTVIEVMNDSDGYVNMIVESVGTLPINTALHAARHGFPAVFKAVMIREMWDFSGISKLFTCVKMPNGIKGIDKVVEFYISQLGGTACDCYYCSH